MLSGGGALFGYVKIEKSELRVREYEYYRAAYCGLCRSMGKCTGQCSRLTLSYDIAFLSQVRMALTGVVPTFGEYRCLVHPFRPRRMMEPTPELAYAADVSALLAYEKCRDDIADKRSFGRLFARVRCLFLQGAYRRARKRREGLALAIREHLAALSALERERIPSVDQPAALFGALLADLFAYELPEAVAPIARVIGDKIGRFIYIVDAVDDRKRDEKSGNFNPVLLLCGSEMSDDDKTMLEQALTLCLDDASAALDLVGEDAERERRAILENIIYLGMPAVAGTVIWGEGGRKEEQSEQQSV
jgi:hypothetical protein